jgi:hypothetical protein
VGKSRFPEAGFRSENEEHFLPALCLLLSAFRRLPAAFQADGMEKALCRPGSHGQDVTADRERKK